MQDKVSEVILSVGERIVAHPKRILIAILILTTALAFQLPRLVLDNSLSSFIQSNSEEQTAYRDFRDIFGNDAILMIAIEDDDIFSPEFLYDFWSFHSELEESLPYYDEINSIVTARNIFSYEDELTVENLIDYYPHIESDISDFKFQIENIPQYTNYLISPDQKMTNILIRMEDVYKDPVTEEKTVVNDKEIHEALEVTKEIASRYRDKFGNIYISGSPVITVGLNKTVQDGLVKFLMISLVVIAAVLFWLFRRISGVVIPLLVVGCSTVITVGLMAVLGQPIQTTSVILPSFILVVGVCDSIHFLTHFYREFDITGNKKESIIHALDRTSIAMLMTTLTTAAGLLTFSSSDLTPIANVGIFAAIGITTAFILTIAFLPAFISFFSIKQKKDVIGIMHSLPFVNFIDSVVALVTKQAKAVVIVSFMVMGGCLYIASGLTFSHNPLAWFPEEEDLRKSTEIVDKRMGGSIPIEVLITAKEPGYFKQLDHLRKLDNIARAMSEYDDEEIRIGRVFTFTDLVKETHIALRNNNPDHYHIPNTQEKIDTEILELQKVSQHQLDRFVNREFSQTRQTLIVEWTDALYYGPLQDNLRRIYGNEFGDEVEVTITGMIPLLASTLDGVIKTMSSSYLTAFVIVAIMMIALLGSVKYGLVSLIPNLFPIIIILAIMRIGGVPLDIFTLMIGSIALGLAIDDTIHFMHTFLRFHKIGASVEQSISQSLHTTGRAMLTTSIVLATGFFVYVLSDLNNLFHFGLLTGICVIVALVADFFLAPALMILIHTDKKSEE